MLTFLKNAFLLILLSMLVLSCQPQVVTNQHGTPEAVKVFPLTDVITGSAV